MSLSIEQAENILKALQFGDTVTEWDLEAIKTLADALSLPSNIKTYFMDQAKEELIKQGWSLPDDIHFPNLMEILKILEDRHGEFVYFRIFTDLSGSFYHSKDGEKLGIRGKDGSYMKFFSMTE